MIFGLLDHQRYLLRLERGEDVHTVLQRFCAGHGLHNATIQGIGSLQRPTLAHYSIETKRYTEHKRDGIYEVTALLGNIALKDGQPLAHLHVTLAGPDLQAIGGHLVKGECSATLELTVTGFKTRYAKRHDETIGLSVWDLPETA